MTVEPGVYLWRSPLGYEYLKDPTGTLDVTPTEERRKLAREFRHHFADTGRPPTPNPDHPAPHPAHTGTPPSDRAGSSACSRRNDRAEPTAVGLPARSALMVGLRPQCGIGRAEPTVARSRPRRAIAAATRVTLVHRSR